MKLVPLLLVGIAGATCACYTGNALGTDAGAAGNDHIEDSGADRAEAIDASGLDPLGFSYIFARYLAGSTPGHCGNTACHATVRDGFLCSTRASCYESLTTDNAMVGGKLVDPAAPASSLLIDPMLSPVFWFDPTGGPMPQDDLMPNDTAVTEITAWIMAGASDK